MARTLNQHTQARETNKNTDKKSGRAKRRERPFGAAVGWAVAATLGVGLIILGVQLLLPSSAVHNMYLLAHYNSSPTLRDDPLFQQWMADIDWEEAVFATPLSLLCGGLTLGWLAPAYAGRGRVLRVAAILAFTVVAVSLAFVWPTAIVQQNRLNEAGGRVVQVGIPPELMVRQAILTLLWIGVCVAGAWAGLWARRRGQTNSTQTEAGA